MPLLLIARIQLNHSAALARGAVKVEHVSYLYNKRRTKNTKRLEKSVASTREDVRRNLSRCRSIGADKLGQKTWKINKESFETCLVSPIIFTYRSISRCIYQPTQSDGTEERVFHSPAQKLQRRVIIIANSRLFATVFHSLDALGATPRPPTTEKITGSHADIDRKTFETRNNTER